MHLPIATGNRLPAATLPGAETTATAVAETEPLSTPKSGAKKNLTGPLLSPAARDTVTFTAGLSYVPGDMVEACMPAGEPVRFQNPLCADAVVNVTLSELFRLTAFAALV